MPANQQAEESDIAVRATTKRILPLDLIRGFFLLVIMINHIELYPNGFDFFTGRGRLFVSAAEGFFFMSGLLIGMVYKRRLSRGMKFIFKKMWQRAAQLYLGSVALTLLFTAWAIAAHHPAIKYGLPESYSWHWIIKETLLMRFGFGWADFLMRFAILMLIAPLAFYLVAKRRWWLMLSISIIAWIFRGQSFTLGWQILFNSGILIGFYWQEITGWYQRLKVRQKKIIKRAAVAVTAVSFAYSYVSVYLQDPLNHYLSHLPPRLQRFTLDWNIFNDHVWLYAQKWTMGPLRLVLFFVWFAVLFALVKKYQTTINRRTRGILELLGRNSLYVYIAHAFVVFVIKFFIPPYYTNVVQAFLVTALSMVILVGLTVVYSVLRNNPVPTSRPAAREFLSKSKALLGGSS